jgi:hypothetical protein
MDEELNRKLNIRARETGQTRAEILKEMGADGTGAGIRKWIDRIKPSEPVTDVDRVNLAVFVKSKTAEVIAEENAKASARLKAAGIPGSDSTPKGQGRG